MLPTKIDNRDSAKTGLLETDLAWMNTVFIATPGLEKVVLFGSRAKGTAKKGSDVDLAVWLQKPAELWQISDKLNEEIPLPYVFDVVLFESIRNEALREHINRAGITLFERRPIPVSA